MADPLPRFIPSTDQGSGLSIGELNKLTEIPLRVYKRARKRVKTDAKKLIEAPVNGNQT